MVMAYTIVSIHIPRLGIGRKWKMFISAILMYAMPTQAAFIIGGVSIWIVLLVDILFIPTGAGMSVVITEMFKYAAPWAQNKTSLNDTKIPRDP
jgi:hypothetical protein